ncbi:MAG TPA: acetaldehyde dehydrogenase (acetylating) [Actinomycetota bacterium]|nr:acetaldehyde dehydrogenase (acetylating) [Actinomycetota bacterium]
MPDGRVPCAVLGTGNIGTDLMEKLLRSPALELRAMVGIDPESDGLARARARGLEATHEGIDWLLAHADEFRLVFEATSAKVHLRHAPLLREAGLIAIDLTPAAVGPAVVPPVNLREHLEAPNLNLITCGGQATVPIVHAVARVCAVPYAEIVSTVASRSAGPGTRQNIDEFTQRTARGLERLGGAGRGKAIIVLNPAEPPILMRNTVYCALPEDADRDAVAGSIEAMVAEVASYVPGYRLKSPPLFDDGPFETPGGRAAARVTVLLEVEGAGDYLPPYAGNLDIMTASAVRVGETIARERLAEEVRA